MVQTICDRCHMVIKADIQKQYPYYTIMRRVAPDCIEYSIDLCPECRQSLKEWMNTFGYNREGDKDNDEE